MTEKVETPILERLRAAAGGYPASQSLSKVPRTGHQASSIHTWIPQGQPKAAESVSTHSVRTGGGRAG
jgi:hypothetical protein